jgi:hypothetical protein
MMRVRDLYILKNTLSLPFIFRSNFLSSPFLQLTHTRRKKISKSFCNALHGNQLYINTPAHSGIRGGERKKELSEKRRRQKIAPKNEWERERIF